MSFNTVHALTGCLLHVEAGADLLGWGRRPLLLLVQDRPAPTAPHGTTRRQMRAVHLPLNATRMGRYRAGLADLLPDLATALDSNQPIARPTLAACVDIGLITDLLADPTPGLRLLAWAICYEDVLVESDDLHEIRRVDAVDADRCGYRITRLRGEPHPVVRVDDHADHDDAPATRFALARLVETTSRPGRITPAASWRRRRPAGSAGPDLTRAPHTVPIRHHQADDLTFIEREASINQVIVRGGHQAQHDRPPPGR
ncbi:hypothetical protein AB0B10_15705 [Micromonospora arborensis]|uniref:hypothetical protein n=1 Tax=Micromonospora arborensis TaxID=2116518 RepID=UPI0033FA1DD6